MQKKRRRKSHAWAPLSFVPMFKILLIFFKALTENEHFNDLGRVNV
jgi:hypothetical protein